jgi:hypothetical protein
MKARRAFYVAAVPIALGCAKTVVQQEPVVPHVIPSAIDSSSRVDRTSYRVSPVYLFHPGTALYDYRTLSTVRVATGDTVPRVDTTTVTALVSAVFQAVPSDNLTIQASIITDSITVRTGSGATVRYSPHTDTLKINTGTGRVSQDSVQKVPCDEQGQEALVRIDDVVPSLLTAQKGTWSDTLVRQVCRAGIQLQARRVTSYQLDSTASELRLLRSTVTTFNGRGVQWNQPVESAGQSTSVDTVFLDLSNRRRIQQIRGTTQLQMNFKSQLRNQQFEQSTQLFVQLR